jgi:hypothetical protein
MRPNFLFQEICKCDKTGIGIIRMPRSVTMFIAALKNHKKLLGMQLPWMEVSQNAFTGIQLRMELSTHQSP